MPEPSPDPGVRPAAPRRRSARRLHALTAGLSLTGHALILLVLLSARSDTFKPAAPEAVPVELIKAFPLEPPAPPAPAVAPEPSPAPPSPAPPAPAKASAAKPSPAKPAPAPGVVKRASALPAPDALAAGEEEGDEPAGPQLTDAQIASASAAGSGGGSGRPCDMARRLQAALRKDARVQAAVADAHRAMGSPRPLWVWNGNWIRSQGQEGNGLAAVREVIMWEVAFAPAACRAEPVRGLILISLNDRPGAAGLVVGSDRWLWSDLLGLRR